MSHEKSCRYMGSDAVTLQVYLKHKQNSPERQVVRTPHRMLIHSYSVVVDVLFVFFHSTYKVLKHFFGVFEVEFTYNNRPYIRQIAK